VLQARCPTGRVSQPYMAVICAGAWLTECESASLNDHVKPVDSVRSEQPEGDQVAVLLSFYFTILCKAFQQSNLEASICEVSMH
jgi:hypothetical protein